MLYWPTCLDFLRGDERVQLRQYYSAALQENALFMNQRLIRRSNYRILSGNRAIALKCAVW